MTLRRTLLGLTVALLVLAPASAQYGGPYANHKLVRVWTPDLKQIEQVEALGGDLMTDAPRLGPADWLFAPEEFTALKTLGLHYKVIDDNIQLSIDLERARLDAQGWIPADDPNWFLDFKNLDQINAKLDQWVAARPDLVSLLDLGLSFENRHIYGIRISGPGANKPAVLFDGTHHAREWLTPMIVLWFAEQLIEKYDTDPRIRAVVDQLEWFIIPVTNPDGYAYTWTTGNRMWRKNRRTPPAGSSCYGVDTNRNYSVGWGGPGSSSNPCSETYRGTAAFSEPENQALRDFYLAHPNIVASISYHTYGLLLMSPYGWTPALPPDHATFMELNEAMHDRILAVHGVSYEYGPIYSTIYPAAGTTVDWAYDIARAFAFTIEGRGTNFTIPPDQIIPSGEENFAGVLYLAEWSASPVKFAFPQGQPSRLEPGQATDLVVKITALRTTINPDSPRLYTRVGTGSFTERTLTALGNDLYRATLPATPCDARLDYYFSAATVGGVVGYSPTGAPGATYQVEAYPIQVVANWDMETNPGWTVSGGLWAWGRPTGGGGSTGCRDPNAGFTGLNVYGYNLSGDYANNMPEYFLTTTPINCTGVTGTHLSFYRWLGVEEGQWDHAYLRISTNGSQWTNVWQNTGAVADGRWVGQDFDISAWADNQPTVYLRWVMGTTDSNTVYCGWNIDDVSVWARDECPSQRGDLNCDGHINFDDINPFVLALSDPAGYAVAYPNCNIMNGDINGDGRVDFDDINPFVALLAR
ncbi:MAG: M14 family zinc carboxypeptidase [Planctomycetota bacterium]